MNARGRPEIKPSIPLLAWVMVELMRARQGLPPLSVRGGSKRLAKDISRDFLGGRTWTVETIRRQYKNFAQTLRHSNNGTEKTQADILVKIGRARRELLGWDASVWLLVLDPDPREVELAAALIHRNELMTH
jgi:hypothetical protein